jgi:hypothetical protein
MRTGTVRMNSVRYVSTVRASSVRNMRTGTVRMNSVRYVSTVRASSVRNMRTVGMNSVRYVSTVTLRVSSATATAFEST